MNILHIFLWGMFNFIKGLQNSVVKFTSTSYRMTMFQPSVAFL